MPELEPSLNVDKYRFYKMKLGLDLLSIDEELMEIGVLIQGAAEMTALATEIRDMTKEELEIVKARVAQKLRQSPTGDVPSEARIQSMMPLDSEYIRKQKELSAARLDASLWQSITEGLRTKSSAMRTSADLINAGFIQTDYIMARRRKELRGKVE